MKKIFTLFLFIICFIFLFISFLFSAQIPAADTNQLTASSTVQDAHPNDKSLPLPDFSKIEKKKIKLEITDRLQAREKLFRTVAGVPLEEPIRMRVLDENKKSVPNFPIYLNLISKPKKVEKFEIPSLLISDSNGFIELPFSPAEEHGKYQISLQPLFVDINKPLIITIDAQDKGWLFFICLGMIGGIALFIWGMDFMGEGLQKWAGDKMRTILEALTKNPVIGCIVGIIVTCIIQSSSATTVILVGFTNAGLMSLNQALGVILGADIGTTITAQLVAFKLEEYALGFLGVGFLFFFLIKKNKNMKYFGQVLFGFGALFLGLKIMSETMQPLKSSPFFVDLMSKTENPFFGIIVSIIFTSIIQSSSATTSLVVALAGVGIISLKGAVPLIFGANIGTCITAAIASIGTSREARRVAIAHYTFKILGVAIFFPFIEPFTNFAATTAVELPRQVANAHTIFNVGFVLIFLPFTKFFEKMIYKIYPIEPQTDIKFKPKYIDPSFLENPDVALANAEREITRMGGYIKNLLEESVNGLKNKDSNIAQFLKDDDDKIDLLDESITEYLRKLTYNELSSAQSKYELMLLTISHELENIGDVVSKDVVPLIYKTINNQNIKFSEEDFNEFLNFYNQVFEYYSRALKVLATKDMEEVDKIINDKVTLVKLEKSLHKAHIERLHQGNKIAVETSSVYLDMITEYKRVVSHAANIAYAVKGE